MGLSKNMCFVSQEYKYIDKWLHDIHSHCVCIICRCSAMFLAHSPSLPVVRLNRLARWHVLLLTLIGSSVLCPLDLARHWYCSNALIRHSTSYSYICRACAACICRAVWQSIAPFGKLKIGCPFVLLMERSNVVLLIVDILLFLDFLLAFMSHIH